MQRALQCQSIGTLTTGTPRSYAYVFTKGAEARLLSGRTVHSTRMAMARVTQVQFVAATQEQLGICKPRCCTMIGRRVIARLRRKCPRACTAVSTVSCNLHRVLAMCLCNAASSWIRGSHRLFAAGAGPHGFRSWWRQMRSNVASAFLPEVEEVTPDFWKWWKLRVSHVRASSTLQSC